MRELKNNKVLLQLTEASRVTSNTALTSLLHSAY